MYGRPYNKTARAIRNSLAALGLLFVLVTVTPLVAWWSRALAGPPGAPRGDVLIVLGGSILDDGTIGVSSYWRSLHAARIFREGGFRRMIVTGAGASATPVAIPMRDFMVSLGVSGEAVEVETGASSTRENAVFTSKLPAALAPGRRVLVTSDYHMFRASRAFRKVGVDVAPWPLPDLTAASSCWSCRWQIFITLTTESAKIAYYYARGWI
jgi:uncharacterized SAM-binding protein YcdF (DUF218 family)